MPAAAEVENENVRVAVRVRPMVAKERLEQQSTCLKVHAPERQLIIGKDRAFTFDFVFGEGSSQQEVYDEACAPLVAACMQGYNATVFAYGQTGSGKTHTMGSGSLEGVDLPQRGVVPRVVDSLFDELRAHADETEYSVRLSYLEIYNEEVKDLLNPRTPSKSISIREDAAGGIFVAGVQERAVGAKEELFECLEVGSVSRATGSTLMNAVSSRSHSLFTIIVEQRSRGAGAERIVSKLHLVDLAGSERAKKTGAVGQRFKESVSINQGLMALGNVIAALCDESRRTTTRLAHHVPYRESKLTRLLQDSLGGNTQTLMIACVSPADGNLDESLNTLRYANRARHIHNKPIVNREMPSVVDLREEIAQLQQQLQQQSQRQLAPSAPLPLVAEADDEAVNDRLRGSSAPLPLSRGALLAIRTELKAPQLQRVISAISQQSPDGTPLASPTTSPLKPPQPASSADEAAPPSPLQVLRHTIMQWGRAEAQRAQLTNRLSARDMGSGGAVMADGGEADGTDGALSDEPARSALGALQRAAERGQLLQSLALQQLAILEGQPASPSHMGVGDGASPLVSARGSRPASAPPRAAAAATSLSSDGANLGATAALTPAAEATAAEATWLRSELDARDASLAQSSAKVSELAAELAEAKADLGRDEQIFAEKLKELRELGKAHASLRAAHEAMQREFASMQQAVGARHGDVDDGEEEAGGAAGLLRGGSVDSLGGSGGGAQRTPPSAASTRSPRSGQSGRSGAESGGSDSPFGVGAAENSLRLTCSPSRAYAEQLEDEDEVLCGDDEPRERAIDGARGVADGLSAGHGGAPSEEIAELERSIRELDQEKAQLVHDQRHLSSQAAAAAAESESLSLDFEAQQEKIGASVRDLTLNIRLKEDKIRELLRADEESRSVVHSYQAKLRDMSLQISTLQEELHATKQEMETAERQADKSEEQKRSLRHEYERRLRETEAQLAEMRRRQREQEKALKSREDAERKLGDLRTEVARMKTQQAGLRDALKSKKEQYEGARLETERELLALRKQSEESTRKEAAEALEVELRRREAVLAEREAVLESREALELRQLRTSLSVRASIDGLSTQLIELDGQIARARAQESSSGGGGDGGGSELVQLLGQRREAQARLGELENLGETAGKELLDAAAQSELRALEERLEDLTATLEFRNSTIGELRQSIGHLHRPSTDEIEEQLVHMSLPVARRVLRANIDRLLELRSEAKARGRQLDEAALRLDERDSELASVHAAMRTAATDAERRLEQAHARHVHELIEQQRVVQQLQAELEAERAANGGALPPTALSPDGSTYSPTGGLTPSAKGGGSHKPAAEGGAAGGHTPESASRTRSPSQQELESLGKDNFYYKQANRELRKKLRDAAAVTEAQQQQLDAARQRSADEAEQQAKLQAELANLKAYLSAHPGATPTRVTKSALKEIISVDQASLAPRPAPAWGERADQRAWTPR